MYAVCLVRVSITCNSWRLYEGNALSEAAAKTMVHAFITSRTDYSNSVLYGAVHLRPLRNVLNSAARIIQRPDHITADIRDLLHWLPVQQRIEYKMCVLVYKCLHHSAPIYLSEFCIPVAATAKWSHLRSAVQGNLVISYCRTKRYGQRTFAYCGPALWNSLSLTDRDASLYLIQFCAQLKSIMFSRAQWYVLLGLFSYVLSWTVLSPVHTSNNVHATLSNATSWTTLSTMSNVASTMLLVWTGLRL